MVETDTNIASPRDSAIAIIKAEHRALGDVVHTLQCVIEEVGKRHMEADFRLIACMLYYIDSFPERCHHPKEDEYLFKLLRKRTAKANAVLDELQAQHIASAQLMTYLEQTFVMYQGGAPDGCQRFSDAVNAYAELLWDHMELEEKRVLVLAQEYLRDDDWRAIDNAFRANDDPLFGPHVRQEFSRLKLRIVNLLPGKLKRRVGAAGQDRER